MKLAFFGTCGAFNYWRIGGTDAVARRLAQELRRRGVQVAFVRYDAPHQTATRTEEGIELLDFQTLAAGMIHITRCFYDHIIVFYQPPIARLIFGLFRMLNWPGRTKFHLACFSWPDSLVKRELSHLEPRLLPYNGRLFCFSPRIARRLEQWSSRVTLLFPPVPGTFFHGSHERALHSPIRVSYVGRLDYGKGADLALRHFRVLSQSRTFQTSIYGYVWQSDPQSNAIHRELVSQSAVTYVAAEANSYTPAIDASLTEIYRQTDVLFLPYRKLSTTIDVPLVLLEAMAHLCPVITTALQPISSIYRQPENIVRDPTDRAAVSHVLERLRANYPAHIQRLASRVATLEFSVEAVANRFLAALEG